MNYFRNSVVSKLIPVAISRNPGFKSQDLFFLMQTFTLKAKAIGKRPKGSAQDWP